VLRLAERTVLDGLANPTIRRVARAPYKVRAVSFDWVLPALMLARRFKVRRPDQLGPSRATLLVMTRENWSWWNDNSAVIVGILSVAVVSIRLLSVSRGDPETAYAILQVGGTGTVLTATLLSTLGLIAIPACMILAFYAQRARAKNLSTASYQLGFSAIILSYIALYMSPIIFLIYGLATGTMLLLFIIFTEPDKEEVGRSFRDVIAGYLIFMIFYGLFSPTPWLPSQAITVAGQRPFSGYVLSQANGETTILTSNPEGIISTPSKSIQATEQCIPHLYLWEQATFFDWLEHQLGRLMTYPSCPSNRYSQSNRSPTPSPTPRPSSTPRPSPTPSPIPTPSPSPDGRA